MNPDKTKNPVIKVAPFIKNLSNKGMPDEKDK
jgi:hypothetical protein